MTHSGPMADTAGEFSREMPCEEKCSACGPEAKVVYRLWESNCGGYEDYRYRCLKCSKTWWIDGIDS